MINLKRKVVNEQFVQASNEPVYNKHYGEAAALGLGLGVAAMSSYAALDVAATVALIGEAAAAVLLIGVAVIAVKVGVKVYKWAAAAL
jgi:hypothetical protein